MYLIGRCLVLNFRAQSVIIMGLKLESRDGNAKENVDKTKDSIRKKSRYDNMKNQIVHILQNVNHSDND